MFNFLRKKKPELPLIYEKLLKKLNKEYPGKYLCIDVDHRYFDHDGGYYTIEYSVYVEDEESYPDFQTFAEVEKYVQFLCKKGG